MANYDRSVNMSAEDKLEWIEYWQKYPVSKHMHDTLSVLRMISSQYSTMHKFVRYDKGILQIILRLNSLSEDIYDQEFIKHRESQYFGNK